MALQTSPPISLNDIKAEFGASGSRSLTEFYRGGAFVPDIPENSGVPTSGSISLLDFLGATAYTPPTANATNASGSEQRPVNGAPSQLAVSTSNPAVVTASGGTGNYTYAWEYVSGNANIVVSGGANNQTQHFFHPAVPSNTTVSATWRCRVSDGVNEVFTNNISVNLSYFVVQ